jgi:uncharacterized protein YbjT (DUF2867 family)
MAKNKSKKTILITGATGHQGGAALRRLREKGYSIRALTRDPTSHAATSLAGPGIEVVRGDFNDLDSLKRAVDGVDGVFLVQPGHLAPEEEIQGGRNLIDAAKGQRLSLLVYSSVEGADQRTGIPFFDSKSRIEEHIRGTGLPSAIFQPAFFMENWLTMRSTIEQGKLRLPLSPSTRLQMIAVEDIGAFVAMAFEHPKHWQGRTVQLAGDEAAMSSVAEAFSRKAGREVQYEQAPLDEFERQMGHDYALMYKWMESGGANIDISALRQENSNLMSFDRWLNQKWAKALSA